MSRLLDKGSKLKYQNQYRKFAIKRALSYKTEHDAKELKPPINILGQIRDKPVKDLLRL